MSIDALKGTMEDLGRMLAGGGKIEQVPSTGLQVCKFAKGGEGLRSDIDVIARPVYLVTMIGMRPPRGCASSKLGTLTFYTAFYNGRWHSVRGTLGTRRDPALSSHELVLHADDALEVDVLMCKGCEHRPCNREDCIRPKIASMELQLKELKHWIGWPT